MYIDRLRIENLRCFKEADLSFISASAPPTIPFVQDWDLVFQMNIVSKPVKTVERVPNINLLLGDNGSGKTSILKALTYSILEPIMDSSGSRPYRLIRRTGKQQDEADLSVKATLKSTVVYHNQDVYNYSNQPVQIITEDNNSQRGSISASVQIERRGDQEFLRRINDSPEDKFFWEELYNDRSPAFFLLGYGATRRSENSANFDSASRTKLFSERFSRVASLFSDDYSLVPLTSWLPIVEDNASERFKEIVDLINKLLPDNIELISRLANIDEDKVDLIKITTPSGSARFAPTIGAERYVFSFGESDVPFGALSDGYRAYVSWIGDMLYHLNSACPLGMKLTDCRGVVMVDEVDLHLHPSWQRTIVDTLSQTFPRIQFILTTHSPIVAATLEAGNIWVMETNSDGTVTPKQYTERIFGLSADQALTSSYFNLPTTRAPGAEDKIRELSKKAAKGDKDATLEMLRQLTGDIEGEDLNDEEIIIP